MAPIATFELSETKSRRVISSGTRSHPCSGQLYVAVLDHKIGVSGSFETAGDFGCIRPLAQQQCTQSQPGLLVQDRYQRQRNELVGLMESTGRRPH